MNTIRDLSILIYGLSKGEKKEFEQYANRQGSEQKYMRVYQVLDKMISTAKSASLIPDEEVLTKRLRIEVKEGNTAAYCTYLFKMILRSLRSNNDSAKKEDDILQNINNAKILARRGLFEAAIDSLETALSDATRYEYHGLAVQALRELVYLEGQKDSKSYSENIKDRLEKIIKLSDIQALESKYFSVHHRAFLLNRSKRSVTHGETEKEFTALRSDPLVLETQSGLHFFAQVYFWQAKASIANIEGELEQALACSKEIVLLWQSEKYKHLQQEHPRLYIIHLQNLVNFAIGSKHFDEGEEHLNTMENFPCSNFDDAAEKFQNVLFTRQLLLLHTNRYGEAVAEVAGKLKDIEGIYRDKINTARLIALYYNTLAACFALKEYRAADEWSIKIYNIGRTEQRRDIQFINKVFQIIIRYELGQFNKLDTEIKNTTQNLRDNNQLDKTNALILHWLAKLVKHSLDNHAPKDEAAVHKKAIFTGFRDELLAEKETTANRQVIGLDEVLMWVEGKVTG